MQIDRNKVQIRTNWQKGTGSKKPENFRNFENFKEKKMSKFTSVVNLWPHNSWPCTLDHLAISLVNNRYKKTGKISKNLLLIFGLAYLPLPLCYFRMTLIDIGLQNICFQIENKKLFCPLVTNHYLANSYPSVFFTD